MVPYAQSGSRWRKLLDLLVHLCSLNLQPFKAIEDEALVQLMVSLDPRYGPTKMMYVYNRAKLLAGRFG